VPTGWLARPAGVQLGDLAGKRILVVEDDPIIALHLQDMLEEGGATVIGPASYLDAALQLAHDKTLDAAVLDVRLEKSDTLPLAELLLERGGVFLFQTSDPGLVAESFPSVPVLRKPFRREQLVASLAALLAKT
jgi:CheY-like chemotaxis protein